MTYEESIYMDKKSIIVQQKWLKKNVASHFIDKETTVAKRIWKKMFTFPSNNKYNLKLHWEAIYHFKLAKLDKW